MITLTIIILASFAFSYWKIDKICKRKGVGFNPFETTFLLYIVFVISSTLIVIYVVALLVLIAKYLP